MNNTTPDQSRTPTGRYADHLRAIRSLVSPLQWETICDVFKEQDALDPSRTPELPEPAGFQYLIRQRDANGNPMHETTKLFGPAFTEDQLREYGRACVAAERDRVAFNQQTQKQALKSLSENAQALGLDYVPRDVQDAEPVADDWYTTESGSLAVDWSHDLSRQLSLILKKDGTVAYAAFIDGKKLHGANAMTPEFYDVLRELVAQPPSGGAEDARDAARYRVLREALLDDASERWAAFTAQPEPQNADQFDAAIDAAIDAMLAKGERK